MGKSFVNLAPGGLQKMFCINFGNSKLFFSYQPSKMTTKMESISAGTNHAATTQQVLGLHLQLLQVQIHSVGLPQVQAQLPQERL